MIALSPATIRYLLGAILLLVAGWYVISTVVGFLVKLALGIATVIAVAVMIVWGFKKLKG